MGFEMQNKATSYYVDEPCIRFDTDEARLEDIKAAIDFLEEIGTGVEWPGIIWNAFAQMDGREVWGGAERTTRLSFWVEFTGCDDLAALFKLRFGGPQQFAED